MQQSFCYLKQLGSRLARQFVCLLVACLMFQQHASVSQGQICSDNFTCCHTEIEVADQTFHLTHAQYTDTRPTRPSTDPITPGTWQGSHWSANFEVTDMTRPKKNPRDLKIGTSVATLPGAWCYWVSAGTGWPCVSSL